MDSLSYGLNYMVYFKAIEKDYCLHYVDKKNVKYDIVYKR